MFKKRLAIIVTALLLVLGAVACGDDTNTGGTGDPTEKTYTVTYSIAGETVHTDTTTGAYVKWTPVDKQGHTFDGWYESDDCTGDKFTATSISDDLTLYGKYNVNEYTVSIDIDGEKSMVKANYGTVAVLPKPETREGYTFDGWYTDNGYQVKYDEQSTVKGNFNLYGRYIPAVHTITLDVDGVKTAIKAAYGTVADIPTGERTGYKFNGWYETAECTGVKYDITATVTGDKTLYGKYTRVFEPTYSASSAATGSEAALAGDGSTDKGWKAAQAGESTLTVDLGAVYDVRKVTQKFAESAVWDFEMSGSLDGEKFAPLGDCTKEDADDTYSLAVNGDFFRYIKLTVKNTDKVASSREFIVDTADMTMGTNIALGMKANSDSWQGGLEAEIAVDGIYDNMYCANDANMGHWISLEWAYTCYITYIEMYMPSPAGSYTYYIEKKAADGSFVKIVDGTFAHEIGKPVRHEINDQTSALVLHFVQTPGWNALAEMNVYGFKNVANGMTPETSENGNVYNIGDSYIGVVEVAGENAKAEYSADGTTWTEVTLDNGFARVNAYGGYVRTSGEAKVFATPLKRDLALYVVPTVEGGTSGDPAFAERACTMNPENTWRQFWCASSGNSERVLTFDLGNACVLDSFSYTFQDEKAEPIYKLKVEISLDGTNYTEKYNTYENGAAGRTFTGDLGGTLTRYVKVTVLAVNNFANCRQFSLYGAGTPVRTVEIR